MLEMPEAWTIARQMNEILPGKKVERFHRGELMHKFLWLNKSAEEYSALLAGQQITGASSYGRSIYLHFGNAFLQWFGEMGGRILYHAPGESVPSRYHLRWDFSDASAMTYSLQMWGFVRLLDHSEFSEQPAAEVGVPPLSDMFTLDKFDQLLEAYPEKNKKGIKGFLVTSQHINGIGNGYLQDILFHARIHPARKIPMIVSQERERLYQAIQQTMLQAIQAGGRDDERNFLDQPGHYQRLMSVQTASNPCPVCGTPIEKIAYLGGACYLCKRCQV